MSKNLTTPSWYRSLLVQSNWMNLWWTAISLQCEFLLLWDYYRNSSILFPLKVPNLKTLIYNTILQSLKLLTTFFIFYTFIGTPEANMFGFRWSTEPCVTNQNLQNDRFPWVMWPWSVLQSFQSTLGNFVSFLEEQLHAERELSVCVDLMEESKKLLFALGSAAAVGVVSIIFVLIWILHFKEGLGWDGGLAEFNWHPVLIVIGFVFLQGMGE